MTADTPQLPPIPFKRQDDVTYGEAQMVAPLVRRVVARNPSPFTYTGTGTFLVGDDELAVIDPGPLDEAHLGALMAAIGARTVSHILITHTHRDHSPLAERLKQATGAKTYGYGPHGVGARGAAGGPDGTALDAGGDSAFVPDIEIRHGDVIEGRGWTVECVFTPGHTSNHMSFALREANALFAGDHVMGWSTSVIAPPDGDMAAYMASLQRLLERDEAVYWPTHGPEIRDPKPFVEKFVAHRRAREAAILERLRQGDRTIAQMVPQIYRGLDERLHPAAGLSVLAHLQHLVEQGRVVTDGAATLESDYRTK